MKTLHDQNPKAHFDWQSEKFQEPRTMPSGWDLSGLQDCGNNGSASPENKHSAPPELGGNPPQPAGSEKFEEPRTTPKYWDVSSLK
jgi:hypothetical protein